MKNETELIIESGKGFKSYWGDLWCYRELLLFLAWRDLLIRYKQTIIGVAWSVLRPFLTMVVFTFVFGKLAKFPADGGAPYPIMVFAALLPWQLFAGAVSDSGNSLLANANLISKVYFPRLIIPVSSIIVSLIDFLIAFGILTALMFWFQFVPDVKILLLPLFMLLAVITALGLGMWFSALNIKYRDFRYIIPFLLQFGIYVSPVGFSSSIVPEKWRLLYSLNPMVGVIDGFRWAVIGGDVPLYLPGLFLSVLFALIIFLTGLAYFRKAERFFADVM